MKDDLQIVDVSDDIVLVKKDNFMKFIYISLIVLVVLSTLIYFFGYNILKPFIEV